MKKFNLSLIAVGLVLTSVAANAARMEDVMDIKKPQIQSTVPEAASATGSAFAGKLNVRALESTRVLTTDERANPRTGEPMSTTRPIERTVYPRGD